MAPRLLDLFCGAGGAGVGYARVGFRVVGIDLSPQPNYPFRFMQMDALACPSAFLARFDAIHASPPCQGYSQLTLDRSRHPRLIEPVRAMLEASGLPYVIENVPSARPSLRDPVRLCGSTFGLDVRRHRYFETNWPAVGAPCNHRWQTPRFPVPDKRSATRSRVVVPVYGQLNYQGDLALRQAAMGIDWMGNTELIAAIPPAYTEYIGRQLAAFLRTRA